MPGQISAIVPTFNRCAFLAETLEALDAQTRQLSEIIVWDDGSSDGTQAFMEARAAENPSRLKYFRAENAGKSRALNAALPRATGDYIWICDDDDVALPDAAELLADPLDTGPAIMTAGKHVRFETDPDSGARQLQDTGYWPDLSHGCVLRHLLEDIFFFQNACLVRREAFDRAGPFAEHLTRSIDYDMFVRLGLCGPIEMVDQVVFHQRKHDGPRGPAAARHAAAESEAVWKEADRAVFKGLRAKLSLELFEAFFEAETPELLRRAALLQRGTVYARRTDWNLALEDFEAAVMIKPEARLGAGEAEIVRRAMSGKHGCREAYAPEVRKRICHIKELGLAGQAVAESLGRGAIWRIRMGLRSKDPIDALQAAMFVGRTGGFRRQTEATTPELRERDFLPEASYPC